MIYGVGIDIENHSRFKKYVDSSFNPKQLSLIFTDREIENYVAARNHLCYALSFSCKEAFFKAFGSHNVLLTEIELLFTNTNDYTDYEVLFSGTAKAIINENKLKVKYSSSVPDQNVIFEAILEC